HRRMGAGKGMMPAVIGALPAIMPAYDTPRPRAVCGIRGERGRRLFLELLLGELASHAAVIDDLDRLVAALDPFRHHRLDVGPGADRLDEHALRFVVFGLRHV